MSLRKVFSPFGDDDEHVRRAFPRRRVGDPLDDIHCAVCGQRKPDRCKCEPILPGTTAKEEPTPKE